MNFSHKMLLPIFVGTLITGATQAASIENCVNAKKTAWLNKQKSSVLIGTETVEMGSCKSTFGCSSNWRKKKVTLVAKKGFQLLPKTIAISKKFGANPKRNNYVKELPRGYKELSNGVITQKYLQNVSIEVACHRRGSPGKAGCDAAGTITVQQIPLLTNNHLLDIVSQCTKK